MKRIIALFIICLLVIPTFAFSSSAAESDEGYWMLSGTYIDEANSVNEDNVKANETITAHKYEIHPGGGSMSTTTRWMDGKEYTVKASFTFDVPEKIKSGETFEIKLKVSDDGSNNLDAHISHSVGGGVWIKNGESWTNLGNASAFTQDFQLHDNPPKSAMQAETVTKFTAPGKADLFTVHFNILAAVAPGSLIMNYDYVYVDGNSTETPTSTSGNTTTSSSKHETTKNPALEDAGCIFSDLAGQVEVLNPIGYDENGEPQYDEDDWHFAKIDEPLYTGTRIKTGLDSSSVVSFADMSTFVMKPSTEIILSSPTSKESKIKLAFGNIWVNVKKMVKDGTMDVEMSQAVAGIKGTIFVCEVKEDGTSTLKVIEGDVQFTDFATGKVTSVTGGEMIAAGLQPIPLSDFDIKAEHTDWQTYDSDLVITNKSNITAIVVSIIIVCIVICGGFVIYIRKRHWLIRQA